MNVIFKATLNERGLLELQTGYLNDQGGRNFKELREMIHATKRIVISIQSGDNDSSSESALCFTIDDSYEPPPIIESRGST